MPLLSTWSRNADLDGCYGSRRAAHQPATVVLHLFTFDPREGGVELSATTLIDGVDTPNGYAPVTVDNTDAVFPDAQGGIKESEPIALPTSTAPWDDSATWAVLSHPGTGALIEGTELAQEVKVTAAGFDVSVVLEITHDELTE